MKRGSTRRRLYGSSEADSSRDAQEIVRPRSSVAPSDLNTPVVQSDSCTDQRLYGLAVQPERQITWTGEDMQLKVLVVDDHAIIRDGLVCLLRLQDGIEVVGEAGNGKEAVEMVGALSPDVVLMDLMMPVMSGLEAIRQIRQSDWLGKILVLSQYNDEPNVNACIEAGAFSFVPKQNAGPILLEAIRAAGESRMTPALSVVR